MVVTGDPDEVSVTEAERDFRKNGKRIVEMVNINDKPAIYAEECRKIRLWKE